MPKKRNSTPITKPTSSVHPSLSVRPKDLGQPSGSSASSSVNERLHQLRLEQNSHGSGKSIEPPPPHTLHPSVRAILQVSDAPPPRPRPGLRVTGGRRVPPGPRAPDSWLVRREQEKKRLPKERTNDHLNVKLPGYDLCLQGSLMDCTLKELARNWDFYLEYEQFYLATLPVRLKELLVHYIAVHNPRSLDRQSLDILFQNATELEEATGADGVIRVDVAGSIGNSIQLKDLRHFFTTNPSSTQGQSSFVSDHSNIPEDWERSASPGQDLGSLARFNTVTHLSLASPGPSITWPGLLSFLTHIPQLTHLSLAFWPTPTLSPNSTTAYLSSPSGPVQYGGSTYYSAYDGDWTEAISLIRRTSKLTLSLTWLDLTGCWPWLVCLESAGIDWTGSWGGLETVKIGQGWVPECFAWTTGHEETLFPEDGIGTMADRRSPRIVTWVENEMKAATMEKVIRKRIGEAAAKAEQEGFSRLGAMNSDNTGRGIEPEGQVLQSRRIHDGEGAGGDDWSVRNTTREKRMAVGTGMQGVRTKPIVFERR